MPAETDQHPDSVTNQKAAPAHELVAGELRGLAPLEPEELKHVAAAATNGELLGQQRVLDAIRLAIGIQAPGYNVFATGVKGSTEREAILRLLREKAATMPTPGDWVYVNNFQSPEAPVAIYLKPGQGRDLRDRMAELITYVKDRPGHDLRYAIDATKLSTELGWKPSLQFEEGLEKTVDWYLANQEWVKAVTSGEYQNYYTEQYVKR